MKNKFNFYDSFMIRYAESDPITRAESKNHWINCHIDAVTNGKQDVIIWTAQILAKIAIVDNGMYTEYIRNVV